MYTSELGDNASATVHVSEQVKPALPADDDAESAD